MVEAIDELVVGRKYNLNMGPVFKTVNAKYLGETPVDNEVESVFLFQDKSDENYPALIKVFFNPKVLRTDSEGVIHCISLVPRRIDYIEKARLISRVDTEDFRPKEDLIMTNERFRLSKQRFEVEA